MSTDFPVRFVKYTVASRIEETDCDWCGEPLETGDTVVTDSLDAVSFTACSVRCAVKVFWQIEEMCDAAGEAAAGIGGLPSDIDRCF